MRKDHDKYSRLIYHNNTSSTADYNNQCYDTASSYTYGQQPQNRSQDYISMLLEESDKLYNKLAEELVDESISNYVSSISSSSSLPLLPPSNEHQKPDE
jgi:hypothetical protein